MADIHYESVSIDSDKDRSEYHYTERRKDILDRIRQKGHPEAFTRRELAEDYDVSVGTIQNDYEALREHWSETLSDGRVMTVDSVYSKAIRELLDDREWRKAARTAGEWHEFVVETQELEELREDIEELKGEGELEAYR